MAMKLPLPLLAVAIALAALLPTGCSTFEHRAKEKAATFESLSPEAREKLKKGVIEVGNTPDMVYIALGAPDERRESTTAEGSKKTWIYNSYHDDYVGTAHAGYRRHVVYNPKTRRYFVYAEPVFADVYQAEKEELIRIVFKDDKVVSIEQPKPGA
jgi:hypothetical protein